MKNLLHHVWDFVCRHAFIVVLVVGVAIIGFLDSNSYYRQSLLKEEIGRLENEISTYEDIYRKDSKTLESLEINPKALEQVARERYFMRRANEDVYIIREQ